MNSINKRLAYGFIVQWISLVMKSRVLIFALGILAGAFWGHDAHAQAVDKSVAVTWTLPTVRNDAAKTPLSLSELDSSYVVWSVAAPFVDSQGALLSPLPAGVNIQKVPVPGLSFSAALSLVPSLSAYTVYVGVYAVDIFGNKGPVGMAKTVSVLVSPSGPPAAPTGVSAVVTCSISKCVVN